MSSLDLHALDRLNAGIFGVDATLRVVHWNTFMATHSGRPAEDVLGRNLFECFPELPVEWLTWKIKTVLVLGSHAFSSWRQRPYVFRFPHDRPLTGGVDCMRQDVTFLPIRGDGAIRAVCGVVSDVTDAALAHQALEGAHRALQLEVAERQRVEAELRLAQRLEAVGRLAAGIAHEINTPIQYVGDTVSFLQDAYRDVRGLLELHRQALAGLPPGLVEPALAARIDDATAAADLDYLDGNVPAAFGRSEDGVTRVAALVRAMKEFGAPDQHARTAVDVNRAIVTTLDIVAAEVRSVAAVELVLGDVPAVSAHGNQINQVLLHLIVNAAHAIADAGRGDGGRIRVATAQVGDRVAIRIHDNGVGIPVELRERIFDLFFTTKDVGRGSGQGLAMVATIVGNHGGVVTVDSEVGVGSTFEVQLPIAA